MANRTRLQTYIPAFFALLLSAAGFAQVPAGEGDYSVEHLGELEDDYQDLSETDGLSATELQELVGPVALYPDDLLAIVLPASTYPLEIVQAARFLDAFEQDSSLEPDEDWDESVVAMLNYPEALRLLDDDIDWTWQLGDAVINQQDDVIGAIESFRDRAYAAGNLKTDEFQKITRDEGVIEIVPIEDDIIYVPYYEPEYVVVEQPQPVYHYYSAPRPVYYYPYPVGHAFSSGYFWGVTTAFRIGWGTNHLRIHHPTYWGHPYYGHSYYGHYYRRPSITVYNTTYVRDSHSYTTSRHRDGDYWRPRSGSGSRQVTYTTYSSRDRNRADTRDYRRTVSGADGNGRQTVTTSVQRDGAGRTRQTTVRTNTRQREPVREQRLTTSFRERSGTPRRDISTVSRDRNSHRSQPSTRNTTRETVPVRSSAQPRPAARQPRETRSSVQPRPEARQPRETRSSVLPRPEARQPRETRSSVQPRPEARQPRDSSSSDSRSNRQSSSRESSKKPRSKSRDR